jgi:hypothetical protein
MQKLVGEISCSVWSVSCAGRLQVGIIGGLELFFYVDASTDLVHSIARFSLWNGQFRRWNGPGVRLVASLVDEQQ